jgi:CubicO group peptidase (beta-lactamase class C family)
MKRKKPVLLLSMACLLASCAAPEALFTDGMPRLLVFMEKIREGAFGEIHGLLIVHKGKLVVEEYFPGYRFMGGFTDFTASDLHNLASVSKSITSLCVGIAVDKGFIKSIDQPFLDFFPEASAAQREGKEGITLRHLLTMTAGIDWDERTFPYTDGRNDVVQLYYSPDPLAFILGRKAVAPPGSQWNYNGGCTNLLGEIVRRSSGIPLDEFAREFLYTPLGITRGTWITLSNGFIYASGDAALRPRDMAKLGMLVLNRGTWNGIRVVSEDWLDASMRSAAAPPGSAGYGFSWWLPAYVTSKAEGMGPVYEAAGWGGQYILIVPNRDLVIAVTGGNYDAPYGFASIERFLLTWLFE